MKICPYNANCYCQLGTESTGGICTNPGICPQKPERKHYGIDGRLTDSESITAGIVRQSSEQGE